MVVCLPICRPAPRGGARCWPACRSAAQRFGMVPDTGLPADLAHGFGVVPDAGLPPSAFLFKVSRFGKFCATVSFLARKNWGRLSFFLWHMIPAKVRVVVDGW
jgi:hypothetical protein